MEPVLYKETKWLNFFIVDKKPKTLVVDVINKKEEWLGTISWHGPWRQYVYKTPADSMITLNHTCLVDIAIVVNKLNIEHKKGNQID